MKAGIDWASEHHDLCVIDDAGTIDQRLRILVSRHAELQGPVVRFPQRTEVGWQRRR